jgi:hypothetical protein
MLAPAGTPTSIVNRLNTEINAIMRTKEMEAILAHRIGMLFAAVHESGPGTSPT